MKGQSTPLFVWLDHRQYLLRRLLWISFLSCAPKTLTAFGTSLFWRNFRKWDRTSLVHRAIKRSSPRPYYGFIVDLLDCGDTEIQLNALIFVNTMISSAPNKEKKKRFCFLIDSCNVDKHLKVTIFFCVSYLFSAWQRLSDTNECKRLAQQLDKYQGNVADSIFLCFSKGDATRPAGCGDPWIVV